MKKYLATLLILAFGYFAFQQFLDDAHSPETSTNTDLQLREAFENRRSNVQVLGEGRVSKVLSDDNAGSRHQRFIVELASGQTVLIAHNIDVAPRVSGIRVGGSVSFYGVYEWNSQGGVVHWTHHDPRGDHVGGWIEYGGKRYD